MSKENVRIEFLLAALNDLEIFACNIGNAKLKAKYRDKILIEAGTEFVTKKGMVMIISRSLYGLKSSGDVWIVNISENMKSLGYRSSEAATDVWIKLYFNPNKDPYYKYILCYVDDLIHIGFNPKEDMDALNLIYRLRGIFEPPD